MNRIVTVFSLIAGATLAASVASAQTPSPLAGNGVAATTMRYSTMPPVAGNPKGTVATATPTAEEAYVKSAIHDAGFSGVNSLEREADGSWHARAMRNNAEVAVTYDHAGHITAQ